MKHFFLQPGTPQQRRYEALRAFYVEQRPSKEVAMDFGYSPGSFRVLCHSFKKDPQTTLQLTPKPRVKAAPKTDETRETIIKLRKQNYSIYDISRALNKQGKKLTPVMVSIILKKEGFARLPRRKDDERPPVARPTTAAVADVRQLDLSDRTIRTRFGGLFLFLPYLVEIPFTRIWSDLGLPGSKMIPAAHAIRSLLGLKLYGTGRHTHAASLVLDEGLGLWTGLPEIPKPSFLSQYSSRIDPNVYPRWMKRWFNAVQPLGLQRGTSFDVDFHTIPNHGEHPTHEEHYVSKRSRRQKGILAFVVHDADRRIFCYANARIRKCDQNDEVLRFIDYWKDRTGSYPKELVFDSRLTTIANLAKIDADEIAFITLRRRTKNLLHEIDQRPLSAWRRIHLNNIGRAYRTPRILDQKIQLNGYPKEIRQIAIKDLGHEQPTLMLTNQLRRSAVPLVDRYARRMVVENMIADGIDFFHLDALSSAVALKVNCDLQLTLMASSLYRLFAQQLGEGWERTESRHLFREFIDASADIHLAGGSIDIMFQKRRSHPLLRAAGFDGKEFRVPWLGGRRVRLNLG
jgi:hypothetical protein